MISNLGRSRSNPRRLQVPFISFSFTFVRGETAEQKVNGEGLHAFYELRGLRWKHSSHSPIEYFLDFKVKKNMKANMIDQVSFLFLCVDI